jgi:hypothetical protein
MRILKGLAPKMPVNAESKGVTGNEFETEKISALIDAKLGGYGRGETQYFTVSG